jgi:alginate O-acetyltransferase complex protein AlgI
LIFSSPAFFLGFLPVCCLGFAIFGRFGRRSAIGFLGLASLVFYAQWNPKFLFVLGSSILLNFLMSYLIDRAAGSERLQSAWLILGIAINLGGLAYFKYLYPLLNFFTDAGLTRHEWGQVALPLGISFFTFTQIAYLVDLKQGVAQRESFLSYVLFVTFFPHLIAGPIIHHKEMMPQFRQERRYFLDAADVSLGLTWFVMGLFKKVIIADRIAPLANALFSDPRHAGLLSTWQGVLAYAMQLYFDFSGYSDMALGLARIFSIRFPINFNSPYKAESIIDYWQRWHITLTRYIMNYVYSPVQMVISRRRMDQGKKVSRRAQATAEGFANMIAFPTIFTLFLAGVWHGAGLQYFIFGLLHGMYLTVNHFWRTFLPAESRLRRLMNGPLAVGITFVFVLVGQVMFRAENVHYALSVYSGMLGLHGAGSLVSKGKTAYILIALLIVWLMPNTQELLGETQKEDSPNWSLVKPIRWQPDLLWWGMAVMTFLISLSAASAESTFLYFQF